MKMSEFLAEFPPCEGKKSILQPGNWVWYNGEGHVIEEVGSDYVTLTRMKKRKITPQLIERYEYNLWRRLKRTSNTQQDY